MTAATITVRGQKYTEQPEPPAAPGMSACDVCAFGPAGGCDEAHQASKALLGRNQTCVTRRVIYVKEQS